MSIQNPWVEEDDQSNFLLHKAVRTLDGIRQCREFDNEVYAGKFQLRRACGMVDSGATYLRVGSRPARRS